MVLPPIKQIATPNGRMYETPEGNLYPSVTTILSAVGDDTWLKQWRNRVGDEEADRVSAMASSRGSRIHTLCENHLRGIKNTFDRFDQDRLAYESLIPYLNLVENVYCIETRLYSDKLKSAGTVDCIAEYNKRLSVIDWKTSKREKYLNDIHSYFIQTAAYAYMYYERTGILIEDLVIVMAIDFSPAKVFMEKTSDWFPKFVEIRREYSKIIK